MPALLQLLQDGLRAGVGPGVGYGPPGPCKRGAQGAAQRAPAPAAPRKLPGAHLALRLRLHRGLLAARHPEVVLQVVQEALALLLLGQLHHALLHVLVAVGRGLGGEG